MSRLTRVLLGALLCCGCHRDAATAPGESVPDTTWNRARFEEYFAILVLQDSATAQPGLFHPEAGFRFSRKATLRLAYEALRAGTLRVVVINRSTGNTAGVWTRDVLPGAGGVVMGEFPRDFYFLHAYISLTRIAAIPFASE